MCVIDPFRVHYAVLVGDDAHDTDRVEHIEGYITRSTSILPILCSCDGLRPYFASVGYTSWSITGMISMIQTVLNTLRAATGICVLPISTSILSPCRKNVDCIYKVDNKFHSKGPSLLCNGFIFEGEGSLLCVS